MSEYVCVRVPRMDDVDIALFDYDRNNTLYFFFLNSDEQIYMRYGGRDSESPDTYLNLASLELALEKGLDYHKRYQAGEIKKVERVKPMTPREIPLLVERTYARNNCVECHLIGDFLNQHREMDGTLDKKTHLYRSPDVKRIGIQLDVPKGLVVKQATGAAESAGMQAGDVITAVNGVHVETFADMQWQYDKTPRKAEKASFTVSRGGQPVELTVALPQRWWWTDLRFRQSTIDPRVYFDSKALSAEQKKQRGLEVAGFASEVTHVDSFAEMTKSHALKRGDIVYAVDGAQKDDDADTADLYIKLRKKAGDTVTLDVLRDGKKLQMKLKTFRMSFRK